MNIFVIFVVNNKENFQRNSALHNINTRKEYYLHRPVVNQLHVSVMEASDDVLLNTIMIINICIFHIFHLLVHESEFLT